MHDSLVLVSVYDIVANFVAARVSIDPGLPAIAGEKFSLDCLVHGANNSISIQWTTPSINNHSPRIIYSSSGSQLLFSPLSQFDNGTYVCRIMGTTISMSYSLSVNGMS